MLQRNTWLKAIIIILYFASTMQKKVLCDGKGPILMLLGSTGAGKSHLGNVIANKSLFKEVTGFDRATDKTSCEVVIDSKQRVKEFTIYDTPGWNALGQNFFADLEAITKNVLEETDQILYLIICIYIDPSSGRISDLDIEFTKYLIDNLIPEEKKDHIIFVFTQLNRIDDPSKVDSIKNVSSRQYFEMFEDAAIKRGKRIFYESREQFLEEFWKIDFSENNWKAKNPFTKISIENILELWGKFQPQERLSKAANELSEYLDKLKEKFKSIEFNVDISDEFKDKLRDNIREYELAIDKVINEWGWDRKTVAMGGVVSMVLGAILIPLGAPVAVPIGFGAAGVVALATATFGWEYTSINKEPENKTEM